MLIYLLALHVAFTIINNRMIAAHQIRKNKTIEMAKLKKKK